MLFSGLSACVDAGLGLDLSDSNSEPALWFVVAVVEGQVRLTKVAEPISSTVIATRRGVDTYLLELPLNGLRRSAPAMNPNDLALIEPFLEDIGAEDCGADGRVVALGAMDETGLEIPARPIASLRRLDEDEFGPVAVLIEDWPAALERLSVRVPLENPCPPLVAELHPFTSNSPIVGFGESIGRAVVSESFPPLANIGRARYLGDGHALLLFGHTLLIAERGQDLANAVFVDVADLSHPETAGRVDGSRLIDLTVSEPVDGRREAHLLAHPHRTEGNQNELLGTTVFSFVVTSTSISGMRARHFEPVIPGSTSEAGLRRIAARPGGGFAAVGPGTVVTAESTGPALVGRRMDFHGAHLAYLPPPFPTAIIQAGSNGWWVGNPEFIGSLEREFADGWIGNSSGAIRLLETSNGKFPTASNGIPELWQRRGDDEWKKHNWWLPRTTTRCSSDTPKCGRLKPQPTGSVRDFGTPTGGGIIHHLDECPAIFRTHPAENRCSEVISLDLNENTLAAGDREVNSVDTRGNRVLIAGTLGLLVELTVP